MTKKQLHADMQRAHVYLHCCPQTNGFARRRRGAWFIDANTTPFSVRKQSEQNADTIQPSSSEY